VEYVEFLSDNLAWLLLSVALGCSALCGLHFLCSELLVAYRDATCAMLSPVRLYHCEYSSVRVDLPRPILVSFDFEWVSSGRVNIRVLWLNASLTTGETAIDFVDGSVYVLSGGRQG